MKRQQILSIGHKSTSDPNAAAVSAVSRALRPLLDAQRPYHCASTTRRDRGDVHRVVIGDSGVFAIETAGITGPCGAARELAATVADEIDWYLRRAWLGAATVRERLRRRGHDVAVQPILCVPFADLPRPEYRDGVIVTRPEHLEYLVRHWPGQTLSTVQATRIFSALQSRTQRVAA